MEEVMQPIQEPIPTPESSVVLDPTVKQIGRPTKYTTDEDMDAKVNEYLETCVDEYNVETKQRTVRLPKYESFSLRLGVSIDTLLEWKKVHPQFSLSLERVLKRQKEKLLDEGLAGNYNPVIAKLGLSVNHGMHEKSEVDQNIKGTISLSDLHNAIQK